MKETTGRRRRARRAGVLVVALAGAGVVVPALTDDRPAAAATLTPFGDCGELDAWFSDTAADRVGPWGFDGGGAVADGLGLPPVLGGRDRAVASDTTEAGAGGVGAPAAAEQGRTGEAVGVGETGTNVQEAGVDEPDVVKTDGRRVVAVSGDTLDVLGVDGGRLTPLGTLRLEGQWTSELLLLGDRALLVGQRDVPVPTLRSELRPDRPGDDRVAPGPLPVPAPPTTVLTVVDLSDPASPSVVRTEEIEAAYLSARSSGGAVRVVLTSVPWLPFVQPRVMPDGEELGSEAEAANRRVVEEATGTDWLPHTIVRDAAGTVVDRTPAVDCANVSHPSEDAGLGTVTVLTLDAGARNLRTTDSTAVAADGNLVYASTDRLYVATTTGGWGTALPTEGPLDSPSSTGTQLHGFDTTAAGSTRYVASGSVPGWLLGRWAMSARDGLLRVATTVDGAAGTIVPDGVTPDGLIPDGLTPDGLIPGTEAVLTVLDEQGDRLVPVGSVGGLGKGEQIRAVRWFGDLAVVVTFRQTDPLYTVDLADPAHPRVVGELKVPGYSAYLHPLGGGLLLGVGQDATDDGQVTGVQVSSFDLRDLAAPGRLDTVRYRDTWSDVEADSRAFSYLPDRRLALLPVSGPTGGGIVAVAVGADGSLSQSGSWSPAGLGSLVQRATPVGNDSVVVLGQDPRGTTMALLRVPDLTELDQARLG
jgi:hypothetical protein